MRAAAPGRRAGDTSRDSGDSDGPRSAAVGRRTRPASVRQVRRSRAAGAGACPSSGRTPGRAAAAYRGSLFVADALARTGPEAIVVAPQGARAGDTDPEYLDWGAARNWETALDRDVVDYVDQHYRTIPTRRGRALLGLSAGGYGAMLLTLHHLDAFSVVESWSGY